MTMNIVGIILPIPLMIGPFFRCTAKSAELASFTLCTTSFFGSGFIALPVFLLHVGTIHLPHFGVIILSYVVMGLLVTPFTIHYVNTHEEDIWGVDV